MKKILNWIYRVGCFTGTWMIPVVIVILKQMNGISQRTILCVILALVMWVSFQNFWSICCEGKTLDEISFGDGLIPDTGLKEITPQKKKATYPSVSGDLLSKKPEGIILGKYKEKYVRIPTSTIFHYAVIGGSGAGKTSTILLDSLLTNHGQNKSDFLTFAIDIKGELNQKATYLYDPDVYVVNPTDRQSIGWDVYYRLNGQPTDEEVENVMEGIAQAVIVSYSNKDGFFVENARTMLTGLLIYYFKKGEGFIDGVKHILESDIKGLIEEILNNSAPDDLHYKYLGRFGGKDTESVADFMTEMTTALSVFGKSEIRFCLRDNHKKASPNSLKEGKSVFLSIPEHMLESYKALLRLCIVQTIREMEQRSEDEKRPIVILIDEFARLGKVDGILGALSTLRSRKVIIMLAFQSMAQLESIYGREDARVIVDNCRAKVILEVSDPQTIKTVTEWAGKYREKRVSLSSGKHRQKTYSYEDKYIVEGSDLINLTQKEEVILIVSGIGYLRVKKAFYFKDPAIKKIAEQITKQRKKLKGESTYD